jgi:hypothetical protein
MLHINLDSSVKVLSTRFIYIIASGDHMILLVAVNHWYISFRKKFTFYFLFFFSNSRSLFS